jgi:hypothetical protein
MRKSQTSSFLLFCDVLKKNLTLSAESRFVTAGG